MAKPRKPRKPKDSFPYGEKYDKILKQAQEISRARYHSDLRSTAKEIAEDGDRDSREQRIDEEADSAVIYTKNALNIIVESDNWLAIEEVGMEMPSTTDVSAAVTTIAFWAYRQDLEEYVQAFRSDEDEDEDE